jgi:hypothetical protein
MPDHIAVGPESCSKASWRKANGVEASKQIRLVKLAHMRYQHPDLQQITNFLRGKRILHLVRGRTEPVACVSEIAEASST